MEFITDLDDPSAKRQLLELIRQLRGRHRIAIVKHRARRSDAQNRAWWGRIVEPFHDYLVGQGMEITKEDTHGLLKDKFLRISVCNPDGEPVGERTRSTTELTTEEFGDLIERSMAWLADMFHIQTSIGVDV